MEDRERAHIALLVQRCSNLAQQQLDANIRAIYASHSAAGRLQSGATITVVLKAMNDIVAELVPELGQRIAAVASDKEAFGCLDVAANDILEAFHDRLPGVIRMANGRQRGEEADSSLVTAIEKIFEDWRSDVRSQLAILAFDFADPAPSEDPHSLPPSLIAVPIKGGRPPAAFWDDMWATIATMLFNGDLNPKSQADVEGAMADWITAHGFSAADSTVRARARRLWDKLNIPDA